VYFLPFFFELSPILLNVNFLARRLQPIIGQIIGVIIPGIYIVHCTELKNYWRECTPPKGEVERMADSLIFPFSDATSTPYGSSGSWYCRWSGSFFHIININTPLGFSQFFLFFWVFSIFSVRSSLFFDFLPLWGCDTSIQRCSVVFVILVREKQQTKYRRCRKLNCRWCFQLVTPQAS
jgi:hypothetical protein